MIVPYNRRRKADALLAGAKLKVNWGPAPTADEIRARDQERFLADAIFTDAASEQEATLARALQAARTADEIAMALVRTQRAQLPAPEDLAEDTGPPPRRDDRTRSPRERSERTAHRAYSPEDRVDTGSAGDRRAPRPVRDHGREMVWFRVNIGRERNADPRWLLPLLCRAGDVTKAEIGAIRIFDRDTRFEIAAEFADKFAAAAQSMPVNEGRISRVGDFVPDDGAANRADKVDPPRRHNGEGNSNATADTKPGADAKAPWRDRKKGRAGGHPYRLSDAPRPHRKGPRPPGAAKSNAGDKPLSKHAHKKRPRVAPST